MIFGTTKQAESTIDPVATGEKLGFYSAMADAVTASELASQTRIPTHIVSYWLAGQAGAGYLVHDVATDRYATSCSWPLDN